MLPRSLSPTAWAVLALAMTAPVTPIQAQQSMEDLAPLVGCWEGGTGTVDMREQWSDADGGTMLGTTRYLRDGALVGFEFARIVQTDTAIVLWPYPGGERSPRGFPLVGVGTELTFANPEHDFPVRIIYRVVADDQLAPRIEGADGEGRGWVLNRVSCPGK